jgi:hypothetical protein
MRARPSRHCLIAVFLAALILPFGFDAMAAQAQVSAALGRDHASYHARARGEGFRVENRKHGLVTDFAASGIRVRVGTATWRLALRGYGYGDELQPVKAVAPQAAANRVEYPRGALTEWYLNGPLGLEQGFTLALTLSGDLVASIDSTGTGVALSRADGTPALTYQGLTAYDAKGRQLTAWLQLSGNELWLRVDDTGAQYPLVVDPFLQQAKLTASSAASVTRFGISVGVSGDTIVVGTVSDQASSTGTSAHVFVRPPGGWTGALTESAKLIVSDGTSGDRFGQSVAISGDAIVVGDPGADALKGAAYVFVKPAGGWSGTPTQSAKLTASDATQGVFGNVVAASGDTIVVAPDANSGQRVA